MYIMLTGQAILFSQNTLNMSPEQNIAVLVVIIAYLINSEMMYRFADDAH